ncbi:MAG: hypothetical protein NTY36_13800 [Deltaproteobacteria bacterium]|nr:hypothetical protein [Deltaproteobacteria bacterium]
MPVKEKSSTSLGGPGRFLPSMEGYLSKEDILRSLKERTTSIGTVEMKAITAMVENPHRDAEISATDSSAPTPSLRLEIKGDKGQKSLTIPVSLKNLYTGMVVLEVTSFGFIRDPETLQGKQAILRVMSAENQDSMRINGIMTWTENKTDQTININLKSQVAQPNKLASKILENSLPAASKEMKRLWTLFDENRAIRESILTRLKAKLLSWCRLVPTKLPALWRPGC